MKRRLCSLWIVNCLIVLSVVICLSLSCRDKEVNYVLLTLESRNAFITNGNMKTVVSNFGEQNEQFIEETINEIELELAQKGTSIIAELGAMVDYYMVELLDTMTEESYNKVADIITTTQEIKSSFELYKNSSEQNMKPMRVAQSTSFAQSAYYSIAVAGIISLLWLDKFYLSAELLGHMMSNNQSGTDYVPHNGISTISESLQIKYIATKNDVVGDITFSKPSAWDIISAQQYINELDAHRSLNNATYMKVSSGVNKVNITIRDLYDYDEIEIDENSSVEDKAKRLCYDAQEAEFLQPFYTVIPNIIVTGTVPFDYEFQNNEAIITGLGHSTTSIAIPNSIRYFWNKNLSIDNDMPPLSVRIKSYAFFYMRNLETVEFFESEPNMEISIGSYAFADCISLASIIIQSSITSIMNNAFNGCTSLLGFVVAENNPNYVSHDGVLYNKAKTEYICFPQGKTILNSVPVTYRGMNNNGSFLVPRYVTQIASNAFAGCSYITNINVDANNANYAGYDGILCNKSLTSAIYFPLGKTSVTVLPSTLVDLFISAPVNNIIDALSGCPNLVYITVDENHPNYSHYDGILYNKEKTLIAYIPLGKRRIYNLPSTLINITIPAYIIDFESALYGCPYLSNVNVDANNPYYSSMGGILYDKAGTYAFVPRGKTTINSLLSTLRNIDIWDTTFPTYIFDNCLNLERIFVASTNPMYSQCDGVLYNKALTEIMCFPNAKKTLLDIPLGFAGEFIIHKNVLYVKNDIFDYRSLLTEIIVAIDNMNYASHDGVLYNKSKTSIVAFPRGKTALNSVPTTFVGSFNIPAQVTSIPNYAEWNCFRNAPNLTEIIVTANNPNYSSLDGVLYNKAGTVLIKCPEGKTGAFVMPSTVTDVANGATENCRITSVVINHAINPPYNLFYNCNYITSMTLFNIQLLDFYPSSLENLTVLNGNIVSLADLINLETVTLGDGVGVISGDAFAQNMALKTIIVNAGNTNYATQNGVLYNKAMQLLYVPRAITGNVTIPVGVSVIPALSFEYRAGVTGVTLPSTVLTIGNGAFQNCTHLANINLPDGITNIFDMAFAGCVALNDITIPDSVIQIGKATFFGCENLASIQLPFVGSPTICPNVNIKFYEIFGSFGDVPVSLETVIISSRSIGNYAFKNMDNIKHVTMLEGVDFVGTGAFGGCDNLLTVDMSQSVVEYIFDRAFENCENLYDVLLPTEVFHIGERAFANTQISSVVFSSYVNTIGNEAFAQCSNLKTVTMHEVGNIGDGAFMGTAITDVIIPNNAFVGYGAFALCDSLESITVSQLNCTFADIFGGEIPSGLHTVTVNGFNIDENAFAGSNIKTVNLNVFYISAYAFAGLQTLETVNMGNQIEWIGEYAFAGCVNLANIQWSAGLEIICNGAFQYCGLETLDLPDSVTDIGEYAFAYNYNLTNIKIPSNVYAIRGYTFYDCSSVTNIVIPDTVGMIYEYAFYFNNPCHVMVADSVWYVEANAFAGAVIFTSHQWAWAFDAVLGDCVVVYGCTFSADGTYVESIDTFCDVFSNVQSDPFEPYRASYTFGGWADEYGTIYPDLDAVLVNWWLIVVYAVWES